MWTLQNRQAALIHTDDLGLGSSSGTDLSGPVSASSTRCTQQIQNTHYRYACTCVHATSGVRWRWHSTDRTTMKKGRSCGTEVNSEALSLNCSNRGRMPKIPPPGTAGNTPSHILLHLLRDKPCQQLSLLDGQKQETSSSRAHPMTWLFKANYTRAHTYDFTHTHTHTHVG